MELFESNLSVLRTLCSKPKQKQSLQMLVYMAIANTTELPAKEVESILAEMERLLELEEENQPKPDQAM
jgi:hypothetical protein